MRFEPPPYEQWGAAQPYEMWAHARGEGPVVVTPPTAWSPLPSYTVLSFEAADSVLRRSRDFSAMINAEIMGPFMGELMLGMDGDEHFRYRSVVSHAFRRSTLERWRNELIAPLAHRLIDCFADRGRAELVSDLTSPFPAQVICAIVGVPLDDHQQFIDWADAINHGPLSPTDGLAASEAMRAYLEPLAEARRAEPTGDLLSELVHAEVDGVHLTDERLYGFLRLLLPAGAETTFRVFGSCLLALMSHPEVLAAVAADRSLVGRVIDETLRWETSVTMVTRRAAVDTEIAGCPVAAGSAVAVLTGSADRDDSRWDDPATWNPSRPPTSHLAFGTGPHQCLGMHLARLELEVGLNAVLDRLDGLRLDPDQPAPAIAGYAFRGPDRLPVLFEAG